nr:MAG TPA_asm: hypothetical protein [Caudoviricetes sp.]
MLLYYLVYKLSRIFSINFKKIKKIMLGGIIKGQ